MSLFFKLQTDSSEK